MQPGAAATTGAAAVAIGSSSSSSSSASSSSATVIRYPRFPFGKIRRVVIHSDNKTCTITVANIVPFPEQITDSTRFNARQPLVFGNRTEGYHVIPREKVQCRRVEGSSTFKDSKDPNTQKWIQASGPVGEGSETVPGNLFPFGQLKFYPKGKVECYYGDGGGMLGAGPLRDWPQIFGTDFRHRRSIMTKLSNGFKASPEKAELRAELVAVVPEDLSNRCIELGKQWHNARLGLAFGDSLPQLHGDDVKRWRGTLTDRAAKRNFDKLFGIESSGFEYVKRVEARIRQEIRKHMNAAVEYTEGEPERIRQEKNKALLARQFSGAFEKKHMSFKHSVSVAGPMFGIRKVTRVSRTSGESYKQSKNRIGLKHAICETGAGNVRCDNQIIKWDKNIKWEDIGEYPKEEEYQDSFKRNYLKNVVECCAEDVRYRDMFVQTVQGHLDTPAQKERKSRPLFFQETFQPLLEAYRRQLENYYKKKYKITTKDGRREHLDRCDKVGPAFMFTTSSMHCCLWHYIRSDPTVLCLLKHEPYTYEGANAEIKRMINDTNSRKITADYFGWDGQKGNPSYEDIALHPVFCTRFCNLDCLNTNRQRFNINAEGREYKKVIPEVEQLIEDTAEWEVKRKLERAYTEDVRGRHCTLRPDDRQRILNQNAERRAAEEAAADARRRAAEERRRAAEEARRREAEEARRRVAPPRVPPRSRSRSRSRNRSRGRSRDRDHSRSRGRDRDRRGSRGRSRGRYDDRSRDRSRGRGHYDDRGRSRGRDRDHSRSRGRSRDRDRRGSGHHSRSRGRGRSSSSTSAAASPFARSSRFHPSHGRSDDYDNYHDGRFAAGGLRILRDAILAKENTQVGRRVQERRAYNARLVAEKKSEAR